jgi:hypothetical protein
MKDRFWHIDRYHDADPTGIHGCLFFRSSAARAGSLFTYLDDEHDLAPSR